MDQRGQLLPQHLRGGIGDDEVERVVDGGPPACAIVVLDDGLPERLALELAHEGEDRRVATACGGDGAGAEVVGGARAGFR